LYTKGTEEEAVLLLSLLTDRHYLATVYLLCR